MHTFSVVQSGWYGHNVHGIRIYTVLYSIYLVEVGHELVPGHPELPVWCASLAHPLRLLSPGVPHLHPLLVRAGESVGVTRGQPVLGPAVRVDGPQVEDGRTAEGAQAVGLHHPLLHVLRVQSSEERAPAQRKGN